MASYRSDEEVEDSLLEGDQMSVDNASRVGDDVDVDEEELLGYDCGEEDFQVVSEYQEGDQEEHGENEHADYSEHSHSYQYEPQASDALGDELLLDENYENDPLFKGNDSELAASASGQLESDDDDDQHSRHERDRFRSERVELEPIKPPPAVDDSEERREIPDTLEEVKVGKAEQDLLRQYEEGQKRHRRNDKHHPYKVDPARKDSNLVKKEFDRRDARPAAHHARDRPVQHSRGPPRQAGRPDQRPHYRPEMRYPGGMHGGPGYRMPMGPRGLLHMNMRPLLNPQHRMGRPMLPQRPGPGFSEPRMGFGQRPKFGSDRGNMLPPRSLSRSSVGSVGMPQRSGPRDSFVVGSSMSGPVGARMSSTIKPSLLGPHPARSLGPGLGQQRFSPPTSQFMPGNRSQSASQGNMPAGGTSRQSRPDVRGSQQAQRPTGRVDPLNMSRADTRVEDRRNIHINPRFAPPSQASGPARPVNNSRPMGPLMSSPGRNVSSGLGLRLLNKGGDVDYRNQPPMQGPSASFQTPPRMNVPQVRPVLPEGGLLGSVPQPIPQSRIQKQISSTPMTTGGSGISFPTEQQRIQVPSKPIRITMNRGNQLQSGPNQLGSVNRSPQNQQFRSQGSRQLQNATPSQPIQGGGDNRPSIKQRLGENPLKRVITASGDNASPPKMLRKMGVGAAQRNASGAWESQGARRSPQLDVGYQKKLEQQNRAREILRKAKERKRKEDAAQRLRQAAQFQEQQSSNLLEQPVAASPNAEFKPFGSSQVEEYPVEDEEYVEYEVSPDKSEARNPGFSNQAPQQGIVKAKSFHHQQQPAVSQDDPTQLLHSFHSSKGNIMQQIGVRTKVQPFGQHQQSFGQPKLLGEQQQSFAQNTQQGTRGSIRGRGGRGGAQRQMSVPTPRNAPDFTRRQSLSGAPQRLTPNVGRGMTRNPMAGHQQQSQQDSSSSFTLDWNKAVQTSMFHKQRPPTQQVQTVAPDAGRQVVFTRTGVAPQGSAGTVVKLTSDGKPKNRVLISNLPSNPNLDALRQHCERIGQLEGLFPGLGRRHRELIVAFVSEDHARMFVRQHKRISLGNTQSSAKLL